MRQFSIHQYIRREDREVKTEELIGDLFIRFLYTPAREDSSWSFRLLASPRVSQILAFWNFDLACNARLRGLSRYLHNLRIDLTEAVGSPESLDTLRKIFERKIRYWENRPMETSLEAVVAPADARILLGSLRETSLLFLKGKFFDLGELLGEGKKTWAKAFREGDFAVFRLTPEKYHYNHTPVSGRVLDFYPLPGGYHSCNPAAVVSLAAPFSKNKRVITIIDTDIEEGSGVGLVAMVEIAALMIGDIVQVYSEWKYDAPQEMKPGLFLRKGQPKSLFRPGSSTVVLFFERGRVKFLSDLVSNQQKMGIQSRFTQRWGIPLAETDVWVRSTIALRALRSCPGSAALPLSGVGRAILQRRQINE